MNVISLTNSQMSEDKCIHITDAERGHKPHSQTDALHALARNDLHAATQNQKQGRTFSPTT